MPDYRSRIGERLGHLPPDLVERLDTLKRRPVWIQAVSVGEAMVARTLMDGISRDIDAGSAPLPVVISSTTPAGRALAASWRLPGLQGVFHFPLDLPRCVDRALTALRPAVYVSIETEIWPMLLRRCAALGIPAIIVNGRISPRSRARYRLVRPLLRRSLDAIRIACMQTREDAARIESIGLPAGRVTITGNMKFDGASDAPPSPELRSLVGRLAAGEPVVVAGSTCAGEEEEVLDALERAPGRFLVLAPRHPDRFDMVASLLDGRKIPFVRRSRPMEGGKQPRVLLLDTVGELAGVYGLAGVAFVGGSLVPRGGQNMIEPAAHGVPVIFGPHTEHFAAVADALIACGGARRVADAAGLALAIEAYISEPATGRAAGDAARRLVAGHRGATDRTVRRILPCLTSARAAECA